MIKKLILPVVVLLGLSLAPSCNSSDDLTYEDTYVASTSVQVTAFSLASNNKLLDSLENVYFSIDLIEGQIFNADSLPYGTNISRLVTNVTAVSTASAVTLTYKLDNGSDSVVNYATNSTDSIDFSNGPVLLKVTSESGTLTKTYTVKVNVHATKPDTLAWNRLESAKLPSSLAAIDAQRTVQYKDVCYTLSRSGSKYSLAVSDNPGEMQWDVKTIALPFDADVETLRASDDAVWMLANDGTLYKSTDFSAWASTGEQWVTMYGVYHDQMVGGTIDGTGTRKIVMYPSKQSWTMPAGFPVTGASDICTYKTPMGENYQMLMVGGRDAAGNYLNSSWAFDGTTWANIARAPLPAALEQVSVVSYDLFYVPTSTWSPVQYPALLAFGGKNAAGINRVVYISKDWGMTWNEAPQFVQLPDAMPSLCGSSAIVHSTTLHLSRGAESAWTAISTRNLWPQCRFVAPAAMSRVTSPVTEWECPAIYMFGGYDADGKFSDYVWRGVILRYTFDPVY